MGRTSEDDSGVRAVAPPWFKDVHRTLAGGDPVLLLVERLDGGAADRGNTHYLLCLGCEQVGGGGRGAGAGGAGAKTTTKKVRGRRHAKYALRVKDPMEGDALLDASLWEEPRVELMTRQPNGRPLDRYSILESTHLCGLGALIEISKKGKAPP